MKSKKQGKVQAKAEKTLKGRKKSGGPVWLEQRGKKAPTKAARHHLHLACSLSHPARQGLFLSFEGTEGCGKSTLIRHLAEAYRARGMEVVVTREPGGTLLGDQIRQWVLHPPAELKPWGSTADDDGARAAVGEEGGSARDMSPWTELFLMVTARVEHLERVILPALRRGALVLCDRFTDSTLAYQGHARGLAWEQVRQLNQLATRGEQPDGVVFLDLSPEVGLRRAQDHNRFEHEGLLFQKKVRQGFLKAKQLAPERWMVVRVGQDGAERVAQRVERALRLRFAEFWRRADSRAPQEFPCAASALGHRSS